MNQHPAQRSPAQRSPAQRSAWLGAGLGAGLGRLVHGWIVGGVSVGLREGPVMESLKFGNLALRFVLELCLLAALGFWGFSVGGTLVIKILLAVAIVVSVAVIWGVFLSPKRSIELGGAARLVLEVLLFALAVAALWATGHPALAAALGVVYAVNKGLIVLWKQG